MADRAKRVVLITGGARSGKSRYALSSAEGAETRAFIATATEVDDEMRLRIETHRRDRGDRFYTVEEPYDLAGAIGALRPGTEIAVVDCLTVWIGNLMYRYGDDADVQRAITSFMRALESPPCGIVIVSNEVGMGIVPENAMARRFRDLAGNANQEIARIAEQVVFMVSGIPLVTKEGRNR